MDTVAKLFFCAQRECMFLIDFSLANEFSNSIINGTKNGSCAKLVVTSATGVNVEAYCGKIWHNMLHKEGLRRS